VEEEQSILAEAAWRLDERGAFDASPGFYAPDVARAVSQGVVHLAAQLLRQGCETRVWALAEGREEEEGKAEGGSTMLEHAMRLLLQRAGGCECAAALEASGVPSLAKPSRAPQVFFDCAGLLSRAPHPAGGTGLSAALVVDFFAAAAHEASQGWATLKQHPALTLAQSSPDAPRAKRSYVEARSRVEQVCRLANGALWLLVATALSQAPRAGGERGPPPAESTAGRLLAAMGLLLELYRDGHVHTGHHLRVNLALVQVAINELRPLL